MRIRNSAREFGLIAKVLHWAIALLILGLVWLGWYMVDLTYYDAWYNDSLIAHKSFGMIVLALALFKCGWVLYSPAPDPVASLKKWERQSSHAMHRLLFVMMLVIPITGYVISTSADGAIGIFNWFEIPPLFEVSDFWRDVAIEVHYYTAYGVAGLVCLHAGAAFKHQFVDRDGTLKRML